MDGRAWLLKILKILFKIRRDIQENPKNVDIFVTHGCMYSSVLIKIMK